MEREGLATANISLVRLHSEQEPSPRALWVPYLLGRPFGVPNDAGFQRAVLSRLFNLLDDSTEPTLIDIDREAPETPQRDAWQPGVTLDFRPAAPCPTLTLLDAFREELAYLFARHEAVVRARGSTMAGQSGLGPDELIGLVTDAFTDSHLEGRWGRQAGTKLLHASRDIMDRYFETALHGVPDGPSASRTWFWTETVAGHVLRRLCRRLARSRDARTRWLGQEMILCPSDFLDAYEDADRVADLAAPDS